MSTHSKPTAATATATTAAARVKRPLQAATRSVAGPPPPPPSPPPPSSSSSSNARVLPLAIQRGAFSGHLLPSADVAASPTVHSRSGLASASLLRSPTKQRAPPAPTPPTLPSAPLLLPPQTPSPSLSSSPSALSPTTKQRVDTKENVPLNPVDALAKKLRQQAAELSDVYEAMEKKEKDVDRLGRELRDVKRQLERRKTEQPPRATTAFTTRNATSARATTVSKASAPSSGKRATPTTAIKAEREATASEALQRLDASMKELRELHAALDRRLTTEAAATVASSGPTESSESMVRQEQQLYIRVLEEAVHLKASELQITGHEELLVVLAELRHTIYEQERELRDVHERNQQLNTQWTNEKTANDEKEQQRLAEIATLRREHSELRAKTEALERQLHEAQRLVHHEVMRLRKAQTTHTAQQERMSQLEAEVQRSGESLQQSERRCERKTRELDELRTTLQSAQQEVVKERERADSTQQELEKVTRQVDELKALQESLLASMDKLVASEDTAAQRVAELQTALEKTAVFKADSERLAEQVTALTQELERSKQDRDELRAQSAQWSKWETLFTLVPPVVDALERRVGAGDELTQLQAAIQDADGPTWLASLVNALSALLDELETARSSWSKERSDLRVTCQELERSTDLTMTELRRVQTQLLETQERLAMSEGEREHLQLEHLALTEELDAAHAQLGLETALSQQLQQLQQIVELQKRRLHEVLKQNDELTTLETNLVLSLETKDNQIAHLETRLSEHTDQLRRVQALEDELEDAAALCEEQQNWNQQLTVELETMELERADSDHLIESLRARESAVSSRLTLLFSQYLQAVSARAPSSNKSSGHEPMRTTSVHDDAMASGDVLQMLRVLPSLVDSYVAIAWARDTTTKDTVATAKDASHRMRLSEGVIAREKTTSTPCPPLQATPRTDAHSLVAPPLQLRDIQDAFRKFKS